MMDIEIIKSNFQFVSKAKSMIRCFSDAAVWFIPENFCLISPFTLITKHQFVSKATEQCEVLEGMYKKMTSLFQSTAKYFAFDPKKYTMEEYFTDVKTFIEAFNVSLCWLFVCFFFFLDIHRCFK